MRLPKRGTLPTHDQEFSKSPNLKFSKFQNSEFVDINDERWNEISNGFSNQKKGNLEVSEKKEKEKRNERIRTNSGVESKLGINGTDC